MKSFWDCLECQEQYKKKSLQCRIVGDFAMLLEKQDTIHKKEHVHMVLKHVPEADVYTNDGIQIDTQELPYSDNESLK